MEKDVVCGIEIDRAKAAGSSEYDRKTEARSSSGNCCTTAFSGIHHNSSLATHRLAIATDPPADLVLLLATT